MSRATDRATEIRLAFAMLTRLPVGRLPHPVPPIAAARWAFPLCGAVAGLVLWAVIALAFTAHVPLLTAALLGLAATALLTGALHEDGLADTADGLGGGTTREAKLAIMRDSRIGSYGVLALIFVIGVKASALAFIGYGPLLLPACLAAAALSRLAMVAALDLLPAARSEGLGAQAGGTTQQTAAATALTALLLIPLCLASPLAAACALTVTIASGAAMMALARRQIGGQTGDILGAIQQISEATIWLALSAALRA